MANKKSSSGVQTAGDSRQNESESSEHHPASSVQPVPPDAKHTGGSPNRQRAAMRGNTEEGAGEEHAGLPAAQHATGSFTGARSGNKGVGKKNGQR